MSLSGAQSYPQSYPNIWTNSARSFHSPSSQQNCVSSLLSCNTQEQALSTPIYLLFHGQRHHSWCRCPLVSRGHCAPHPMLRLCSLVTPNMFTTLLRAATDQNDIFTELICISSRIFAFLFPHGGFTGFRSSPWAQSASIQFALPSTRFEAPTTSTNMGVPKIRGTHWSKDKAETWQSSSCAFQDFLVFLTNSPE